MPHYDEARGLLASDLNGPAGTISTTVHAAASKTPPVDADELPLMDSDSSFSLKKLAWANVKATLKTYFDTLYLGISATAANAAQLLGGTWVSPGAIGSTTPNTGALPPIRERSLQLRAHSSKPLQAQLHPPLVG